MRITTGAFLRHLPSQKRVKHILNYIDCSVPVFSQYEYKKYLLKIILYPCLFYYVCYINDNKHRLYDVCSLVENKMFAMLLIGLVSESCSQMVRKTWVQSQVASYQRLWKWYLIPPCLTLSNIRYVSRVKWSNPRKGVAPSPSPRCSSYWKGSLRVALD